MTDILFFLFVFVAMLLLILTKEYLEEEKEQEVKIKKESIKSCPPHAWKSNGQPGEEGVTYLACSKCGNLPSSIVDSYDA